MHHYREFYMHGTGHWLGMGVHDVGDYKIRSESRTADGCEVLRAGTPTTIAEVKRACAEMSRFG